MYYCCTFQGSWGFPAGQRVQQAFFAWFGWTPNFASAGLSPRLKDSRHALLLCWGNCFLDAEAYLAPTPAPSVGYLHFQSQHLNFPGWKSPHFSPILAFWFYDVLLLKNQLLIYRWIITHYRMGGKDDSLLFLSKSDIFSQKQSRVNWCLLDRIIMQTLSAIWEQLAVNRRWTWFVWLV